MLEFYIERALGLLSNDIVPGLMTTAGEVSVVLAGDFYTVPGLDRRGGTGDVNGVWQAFANDFDWVVGVAGNHDFFGSAARPPRFSGPLHFLDHRTIQLGQLQVAGLSGIRGNPNRAWRRAEGDYLEALEDLLLGAPSMVVMHDGPDVPELHHRGSPRIRQLLEQAEPTLVVRGHCHWDEPLAELSNGTQVLNVDARVVILTIE